MTSPLDGRIRVAVETVLAERGSPDVAGLQQQITDLHEHLHYAATAISRLEDRVSSLEQAAGIGDLEQSAPVRRTRRKTASE